MRHFLYSEFLSLIRSFVVNFRHELIFITRLNLNIIAGLIRMSICQTFGHGGVVASVETKARIATATVATKCVGVVRFCVVCAPLGE